MSPPRSPRCRARRGAEVLGDNQTSMGTSMSELSPVEQHNVRIALRVLRVRYQGWGWLAKALRRETESLAKVARGMPVTADLAFRVAKLAEVEIGALVTGGWLPSGTCPHCGKRSTDDFEDEGTVVDGVRAGALAVLDGGRKVQ